MGINIVSNSITTIENKVAAFILSTYPELMVSMKSDYMLITSRDDADIKICYSYKLQSFSIITLPIKSRFDYVDVCYKGHSFHGQLTAICMQANLYDITAQFQSVYSAAKQSDYNPKLLNNVMYDILSKCVLHNGYAHINTQVFDESVTIVYTDKGGDIIADITGTPLVDNKSVQSVQNGNNHSRSLKRVVEALEDEGYELTKMIGLYTTVINAAKPREF